MTIFDSLRYPISDQPTFDELDALPIAIWNDFLTRSGDKDSTLSRAIAFIFLSSMDWVERVELLRRTILEYDVQENNEPITKID